MCGITGKAGEGAIDEPLLRRMCGVLEHRGPDSGDTFVEDGVGLGIRRLSIIDLETGDQPIFNEDRTVLVVQNGEIYNYVELRSQLEAKGHRFRTSSDTEVIVHLYEEYGADCVRHLRGMFAFAVWDRRTRSLLLGRDRLGKKPLYYAVRDGTLWFGSEVRALLEDPDIRRAADHSAIDAYLQLQYVPDPSSAFAGISRLPAAHTLTWAEGRTKLERYWELSYSTPDESMGRDEACERIRHGLMEATRLRLRSDVPLGAFLSGGVDSSAVVAAMARLAQGKVKTFSIGFENPEFDERPAARLVAEMYGTEHHEFVVGAGLAGRTIGEIAWRYGEPFADHSAIPTLQLADLTSRHVKVALNGDGGDESFAGYSRYRAARIASRLSRLPAPARRAAMASLRVAARTPSRHTPRQRLERMADSVLADGGGRFGAWLAFFSRPQLDELYTPEFRDSLQPFSVSGLIDEKLDRSDATSLTESLLDADIQTYLVGDLLVKMDISTMAHSLEARSPLLDHEYMEMTAALPDRLKLGQRDPKHLFKRAVRPLLPRQVLRRPKMGFTIPLADWFRGELRDLPRDVLLDPVATDRAIFRPDAIQGLIDDHVSGRADHANRLWALVQLELWFRTFIDARRDAPLTLSAA